MSRVPHLPLRDDAGRRSGDDGLHVKEHFATILFTDLVGSTTLFDRRGDEAADAVRREHFAALRRAIAEHGGREVKSTGDGLMVTFSSAVAAVRCAVDMLASEVVCRIAGPRVAELIQPAGALRLRGISERVAASHVRWRERAGEELEAPAPTAAPRQIDVVVADDQRLLRSGFRVILEAESDLRVVGEEAEGASAA